MSEDIENVGEENEAIAIIGMAGRFPGARDLDQFWQNLCDGVDAIEPFTDEQIKQAGLSVEDVRQDPNYVAAGGILRDPELFDAEFFGYNPQEAKLLDPQHRLLLETSWQALESAGYNAENIEGSVGVFVGKAKNSYLMRYLLPNRKQTPGMEDLLMVLGNESDYLSTTISYRLGLNGPSINIHTACSTSLVAIHHAKQSLLNYECDVALAGGVCIRLPETEGYSFNEGNILSSDGHTRTFAEDADGTIFANGAGVVALKRLSEALEEGDNIIAVIRGSAINNDGPNRQGFMAPSVAGQAEVVRLAHADAEVSARDISYVEGHGTATPLGDPIEVAGLTQAFRASTNDKQYCALGSVKSNIGHLDAAAGVSGLIKTALSLQHKLLPPSINISKVNPKFTIEDTPFFVNTESRPWQSDKIRRAGVSSFGAGGTNAHVILEEAPERQASDNQKSRFLLPLSAKNEAALQAAKSALADHLETHADMALADVEYTLWHGRKHFSHRAAIACTDVESAIKHLRSDKKVTNVDNRESASQSVVFMFPGQGAQAVNMARTIYEQEPVFKQHFDYCCDQLQIKAGLDLRSVLYPPTTQEDEAKLQQTCYTQPALFVIEYCMAQLWQSWGVTPSAMIGHSIGEYVAACLAGVFSLEDALQIVAKRGALIQSMPTGTMLAVPCNFEDISHWVTEGLSVAAINTPDSCVISGPSAAITQLSDTLQAQSIASKELRTSHAFHSAMMNDAASQFEKFLQDFSFNLPQQPFISCRSGHWIKPEEATNPAYWAEQIRAAVQFAAGCSLLLQQYSNRVFLEVGPGNTLTSLTRQIGNKLTTEPPGAQYLSSLGHITDAANEGINLLTALGRLWSLGIALEWDKYCPRQSAARVPLPTYCFQRKAYWVTGQPVISIADRATGPLLPDANQHANTSADVDPASADSMTQQEQATAPVVSRHQFLVRKLQSILEQISGMSVDELDPTQSFIQLGFDSLFLTQASNAFKKTFKIDITFRQLLDKTPTIESLASLLEDQLDSDAFAPQELTKPVAASATTPKRQAAQPVALTGQNSEQLDYVKQQQAKHGPWKAINRSRSQNLSALNQTGIDLLVEEYVNKYPGSKKLVASNRAHFADPRSVSGFNPNWKEVIFPIVTQTSAGSRMWDIDGNEFIDVQSGFGSVFFGHNPDFIRNAIEQQLQSGVQIGPQSHLAGAVAKKIAKLSGMDRVTFCNTGSEAVLAAMRIARTVTGRDKIVMFAQDYHGIFDEVVARSVNTATGAALPAAPGIPQEAVSNIVILEYGDPQCLNILETMIDEIAAVLIEPIQSRRPDFQPREFLTQLRQWTVERNVVFIFDEVITGFRLHHRGAQAWYGIDADLVTYGKVIGGGMPAGVLAGRHQFMDALDGGAWQYGDDSVPEVGVTYFAGTFVRHPLTIAAMNAVADFLLAQDERLYTEFNNRADRFADNVNQQFAELGVPLHLQHCGSMFAMEFLTDSQFNPLLYHFIRLQGVHILDGGTFFLTLAHSDEEIVAITEAFVAAAKRMQQYELLPTRTSNSNSEFPLTPSQHEIWLATRVGDDASCAYNLSNRIHLNGDLDRAKLSAAMCALVNENDALRTTISTEGIVHVSPPLQTVPIRYEDLSHLNGTQQQEKLTTITRNDVVMPFQLESEHPIRFFLFKLGEREHLIYLTVHHIVCDGWSAGILLLRLGELYAAKKIDKVSTDRLQFSQYAAWLQEPEQQQRSGNDKSYWLSIHKDAAQDLELPADFPRPPLKTYNADRIVVQLAPDLNEKINQASRQCSVTPFTFLLSAFGVLISRLTGQQDFNVGIPAAGQLQVEDDRLVGHCVNFLPLRLNVAASASFTDVMNKVQSAVFDGFEHQFFTYGELVQELALTADPSRNPLVSVVFNVDRMSEDFDYGDLDVKIGTNPRAYEVFELFLNIVITGNRIELECTYNTDLYAQDTVRRWMDLYKNLINSALVKANQSVQTMPLLSAETLREITIDWNNTQLDFPKDMCLHDLVSNQAQKTPTAIAVKFANQTLTYEQLEQQSNQLAHYLLSLGVRPDQRVGLCVDRGGQLFVALLGILKAGGAYVPLDPEYPLDRLAFMVEDAALSALVADGDLLSRLPQCEMPIVRLDQVPSVFASQPTVMPATTVTPENTAYVIYTSGSTGKPKGVLVPHRSVVNLLFSLYKSPGFAAGDTIVALTTLSFDIAVPELFLPLTVGSPALLLSKDEAVDGVLLRQRVEELRPTFLSATPATWRMLIAAGWEGNRAIKVVCTGEPMPADLAKQLFARCSELWDLYGPTETTVWSTGYKMPAADAKILIGKPIHNTQIYVLDTAQQPVPVGVPGEMYIGGSGVTRGYWQRDELSQQKFIDNTINPQDPGKLYRTGDLVRYLADGNIEYLGRLDNQVKVRGFRIELGEIESLLAAREDLNEVVVVARQFGADDNRLVAYYTTEDSEIISANTLREDLAKLLPEYMIPAYFVAVEHFPLTPSGKIDKKVLPAPDLRGEDLHYQSPETETECKLAQLWGGLLGVDKIGVHDNFFELGGHSLLAVKLSLAIKEIFGLNLNLRVLFTNPSLKAQALLIAGLAQPSTQEGDSSGDDTEDFVL